MRAAIRFWVGAGLALSMSLAAWGAPNWKTLTDAPRDIGGARTNKLRPVEYWLSEGSVVVGAPNDEWAVNHLGQMGADLELLSDLHQARLGIWAGASLQGKNPRAVVAEWASNISNITGGTWTAPKQTSYGGIPCIKVTGVDAFGNYHYALWAWTRYGINYGMALRTPYENRWNTDLERDLAYLVEWTHMSTSTLRKQGYRTNGLE